jgi:hypothetical protein
MTAADFSGGLGLEQDLFFAEPPSFAWLREGTSFWLFEADGAFGIPRNGVEAEPQAWESRRYQANLAFADGRVLLDSGVGAMRSPLDAEGRPAVLGAGPLTFRCLEPFRRWLVSFDGTAVDTTVAAQIARTVDETRRTPLRYAFELEMAVPAFLQDVSPTNFQTMGKGVRRDALSVGLGMRFEQLFRGEGELELDGERRTFKVGGMRVKRRSVRTDGLFLRGHCWQSAIFPDGRAFGYLAYPPHADGFEAWNDGFIYQDGRMYPAKAVKIPWLDRAVETGDDVGFALESELGVARIEGRTTLSTFRLSNPDIWGINLQQTGVRYVWDGQASFGMLERSSPTLGG